MSFNFRDVTVDPRTGAFVDVLGGPGVVFIRGLVDHAGQRWTVEVRNDGSPGVMLRCDGQAWHWFGGPYGYGMGLLRLADDGEVEVYLQQPSQDGSATCPVEVYSPEGTPLRAYTIPYSSMGLLYTQLDGTPVPDQAEHVEVIHGVDFYHPTHCEGYTVGLGSGGGPFGSINVATPDGRVLMAIAPADIPLPPRIAVNAAGDFAAVGSFEDAPPSTGMTWVPYAPGAPVTPDPLPPLPDVPAQMPNGWMGVDNTKLTAPAAGNCAWSPLAGDARPWMEDKDWPAGIGPMLCGVWVSDGNKAPETVDAQMAYVQLKRAHSLYLHQDDASAFQTQSCRAAANRIIAAKLTPIHGRHVVLDSRPTCFMADCLRGYSVNLQTIGRDNAQVRLNAIWAVEQYRQGHVDMLWFTRWFACKDAELLVWLGQVMAKVQAPVLFPGQPLPDVTPDPPVTPPVTPPSHGHGGIIAGIAIGSVVTAVLIALRHKPNLSEAELIAEVQKQADRIIASGDAFLADKGQQP